MAIGKNRILLFLILSFPKAGHAQLKFVMTECSKTQIRLARPMYLFKYPIVYSLSRKFGCKNKRFSMSLRGCSSLNVKISVIGFGEVNNIVSHLGRAKRICVFEHSIMTNFNCACPAIQRGQGSGFLSEGSSWLTAFMSGQRMFWRDCADAQAHLNLRCSHRR